MRIRLLMSLIILIAVPCVWGQVGPDFDFINSDNPTSTMGLTSGMAEYSNLRLTNDPGESVNPRVVVDADFLYVVWEDTRDGNREIFWQKFSRGVSPVTNPINLSNTTANSVKPAIGVDGSGNSYVAWQEDTPWGTIYGLVTDSEGNITVTPIALSSNLCLDPDIAVKADGSNWVVYHRRSASDQNVYARLSTGDFTQTCVRGLNAGTLPSFDKKPAVTINTVNGEGYICWRDMDTWWYDGIYATGLYPNCDTKFSRRQATGDYENPDMGFSGAWPWMVAQLSGNIYNLYGTTSIYRINEVSDAAANPQVGDDPDYGYVVWQDNRNGDWDIYLSLAYGNTAFPDVRLTEDPASSTNPDIASHNPVTGEWWVVWQDLRDGNWEIYMSSSLVPNFCDGFEGLFCDDFEDGVITDWQVLRSDGVDCDWTEGGGIFSGSVTGSEQWCIQYVGNSSWDNYIFEGKVRGNAGVDKVLIFRIQDANNFYAVNLRSDYPSPGIDQVTFDKMIGGVYHADEVTSDYSSTNGVWYQMKVECLGNDFRVYVDDNLVLEYTDNNNPYYTGGIGLACWTGYNPEQYCDISFDNVAVTELTVPHIHLSQTNLSFSASQNGNLPDAQTFTISNTGGDILGWYIDEQISWLDITPYHDTSNSQEITVTINTTGLFPGTYNDVMTVTSTNADNTPQMVEVEYTVQPSLPSLKIYDGAPVPQPIVSTLDQEYVCRLSRVESNNEETEIAIVAIDENGIVPLDPAWFSSGDTIKVEIVVHTLESLKPCHELVDSISHVIWLDNAEVNSSGPLSYDEDDTYQGIAEQPIYLNHTTVKYNLMVVLEWDESDGGTLQSVQDGFKMVANFMYDVTDGQATLGTVAILDCGDRLNAEYFEHADVRIYRVESVSEGTPAHMLTPGYYGIRTECSAGVVELPRCIYSNLPYQNRELILTHGINWTIEYTEYTKIFPYWHYEYHYPGIQGIMHELGHYFFYLGEEYEKKKCQGICSDDFNNSDYNFGLMDQPYYLPPTHPRFGEMSTIADTLAAPSYCCHNFCLRGGPCWTVFETAYEGNDWGPLCENGGTETHPYVNIVTPEERGGDGLALTGPNNDLVHPDIDCGAAASVGFWDTYDMGENRLIHILTPSFRLNGASPADWSISVQTINSGSGYVADHGHASDSGYLMLLGVVPGDSVIITAISSDSSTSMPRYWSAVSSISGSSEDTVAIALVPITSDVPLAISLKATNLGQLQLLADYRNPFAIPPDLSLLGSGGAQASEQLVESGSSYLSTPGLLSGDFGDIFLEVDGDGLLTNVDYLWTIDSGENSVGSASSRLGGCNVILDSVSMSLDAVLVGEYYYLLPTTGLPGGAVSVSKCFSISTIPEYDVLTGGNYISIVYSISDLSSVMEDSLGLYRWDRTLRAWQIQPVGVVDSSVNEYSSALSRTGLYTLVGKPPGCCTGIRGNADSDSEEKLNISDITYLVSYCFGGGTEPECIEEGNVNGDEQETINISDITYLVAYCFGGGPAPPACP